MNYKMVGFVLGRIFLIEAALMLFPMGCAAIYGEWSVVLSFLWPMLIVLALGLITSLRTPQNTHCRLSSPVRYRPLPMLFLRRSRALRRQARQF